jgi:hypothetical protein
MASNQTAFKRLFNGLTNEMPLYGPRLNQVDDRSQGPSELKALALFHIRGRKVSIMENEYPWYFTVPTEAGGHGHVQLRRVDI